MKAKKVLSKTLILFTLVSLIFNQVQASKIEEVRVQFPDDSSFTKVKIFLPGPNVIENPSSAEVIKLATPFSYEIDEKCPQYAYLATRLDKNGNISTKTEKIVDDFPFIMTFWFKLRKPPVNLSDSQVLTYRFKQDFRALGNTQKPQRLVIKLGKSIQKPTLSFEPLILPEN